MSRQPLKALVLEDDPADAELIVSVLEHDGYRVDWTRVADETSFEVELSRGWDVVLADYALPDYDGLRALKLVRSMNVDIPFILVTGTLEIHGLECLRAGADDYLLKDHLARLPSAVERSMDLRQQRAKQAVAVRALRQSERRFRLLFESSFTGIYVSTPEGRILDCNPTLARIMGFESVEEALRSSADSFYANPERRHRFLSMLRERRELPRFENRLVRADGESIDVIENAVGVFDQSGRLTEIYGYMIDVTTERAAQLERDQLADAISQAAEGVVLTDADGVIVQVNPSWERITGFTAAEAVGRTPAIVKSGIHDEAFYEELWGTIVGGETWSGRIVNKRTDGTLFHVDATISPVRGADGSITGYMAFQKDITREVELEQQLHAAQRLESVGQLAAGVAHDFNNLMTVVQANTQLALLDLEEEDPTRATLTEVLEAVESGRTLTRQLLAFGRKQALRPAAVELNDIVAETEGMLHRTLGEDIQLDVSLSPETGSIYADPTQLKSVILNMAINARDAMPDGGCLSIQTSHEVLDEAYVLSHVGAREGPHAVLSISDEGVGMDEEIAEHIFEPFFTTKGDKSGTGLGLAMVYGTVKQSNGSIWVYSEPGTGTTFKIYLPIASQEACEAGDAAISAPPGELEAVLVIEDNDAVRRGIERMLLKLGYKTVLSGDPEEALSLLAELPSVDLVLTDVVMPGMTGVDLARSLAESRPRLPVLFMSGYSASQSRGLPAHASFLEKPFTLEELARSVRAALG